MKKCHISILACTAALIAAGVGAAPPAASHTVHVVHPGESIQKAVDGAAPGDTVQLTIGTYYESVKVSTPGLTLRGLGRSTVIRPATEKVPNSCAEGGNGICVEGTKGHNVEDVTVSSLTVTGFARAGVMAMATDRLTVHHVRAVNNG